MMYEGKAVGGPRGGIKLTADLTWDGMIEEPRKANTGITYHHGHYKWSTRQNTWVWSDTIPGPTKTKACTGQFHVWLRRARYGTKCMCGKKVAVNLE